MTLKDAAEKLVLAHAIREATRRALYDAEHGYQEAEQKYLQTSHAVCVPAPTDLVFDGKLIHTREDYYDCKEGERVEVRPVAVIV